MNNEIGIIKLKDGIGLLKDDRFLEAGRISERYSEYSCSCNCDAVPGEE